MTLWIHMFVQLWNVFPEELTTNQDYINKCNGRPFPREKKLYDPLLWMGFNFLKATESLQRGNLPFTTNSPGVPGTHLIDLGGMKK